MAAGYDGQRLELLERAERRAHFWFEARGGIIADAYERHGDRRGTFVDLGCGTGYVADVLRSRFPELRAVGCDPLHGAAGTPSVRGSLPRSPFRSGVADAVGLFDVLEHLDDDVAALDEVRRLLRPHGTVLLTVPQHRWLWGRRDVAAGHRRRYTRRSLREALAAAGFRPLELTSFMTVLLPLVAAARGVETDRVPRPALNRVLGRVAAIDRYAIRRGLTLPFGGSLLAVARPA
jgi:SAM-dependent methyltransferase